MKTQRECGRFIKTRFSVFLNFQLIVRQAAHTHTESTFKLISAHFCFCFVCAILGRIFSIDFYVFFLSRVVAVGFYFMCMFTVSKCDLSLPKTMRSGTKHKQLMCFAYEVVEESVCYCLTFAYGNNRSVNSEIVAFSSSNDLFTQNVLKIAQKLCSTVKRYLIFSVFCLCASTFQYVRTFLLLMSMLLLLEIPLNRFFLLLFKRYNDTTSATSQNGRAKKMIHSFIIQTNQHT